MDAFIEQIQLRGGESGSGVTAGVARMSMGRGQNQQQKDIFKDIVPLCDSSWQLIAQVNRLKLDH